MVDLPLKAVRGKLAQPPRLVACELIKAKICLYSMQLSNHFISLITAGCRL